MRTKIALLCGLILFLMLSCVTETGKVSSLDEEVNRLVQSYLSEPETLLSKLDNLLGSKKNRYSGLYARIYISAGEFRRAKDAILANKKYKESTELLELLAIAELGLNEDYGSTLSDIIALEENNTFALNKLAQDSLSKGSLDKAEELLTKSYKTDHRNNETKILLGDLALERVNAMGLNKKKVLSQREEANIYSYYNLALDYYLLVQNSTNPAYYVKLSGLYKKLGKKIEAVNAISKAIEYESDNIWNYFDRGKLYFYMGEYELAKSDLMIAYSMDKNHFFTNVFLGRICFINNETKDALKYYNNVLNMNPNYSPAYRDMSILYYVKGDIEKSLEFQIRSFESESVKDQFIPLLLVETLLELDREAEARKILLNLVKYEKNSTMKDIYRYYIDPKRTGDDVLSRALSMDDWYMKTRLSYYISCALLREGVKGHSEVILQDVVEADIDFESKLARYKLGE